MNFLIFLSKHKMNNIMGAVVFGLGLNISSYKLYNYSYSSKRANGIEFGWPGPK